ncbi:thiamine phosphate synthase [Acetobacterium wieringae]|uniref:thiamine phosphate synthase n=1 Tax=Acetobacterium wieringae TaxID=52694 RepID=UPI0020334F5C|nr:thiamine phosphate synthase [Acetobacterium wieringae]URN84082.1 thiamine phosphate synthase [Acetobacterium wieringae]
MKLDKQAMLLYAVTDRSWLGDQTLVEQVEETLKGGATFIQLREKELEIEDFIREARAIKKLTDAYKVPFVINDAVEVALAVDADGVHVGQDDMDARELRKRIGDKIIGVSADTVELALKAEADGADYIGVGAIYATDTKADATVVAFETIAAICQAVSIPVVAIGGLNETNIHCLAGMGVDGVALVSAIFSKADIRKATRKLRQLSEAMTRA